MSKKVGCPVGQIRDIESGICDTKLNHIKRVVKEHQYIVVVENKHRVLLDATSANAILTVRNALNNEHKKKLDSLPIYKQADIAWKLVN
jgi:hypothetical protein